MDFESLRNLEDVLAGQQVVLAEMTDEDWDQKIPNAWLASEKGHPFWLFCIQQIIKAAGSCAATNTDRWFIIPSKLSGAAQHLQRHVQRRAWFALEAAEMSTALDHAHSAA